MESSLHARSAAICFDHLPVRMSSTASAGVVWPVMMLLVALPMEISKRTTLPRDVGVVRVRQDKGVQVRVTDDPDTRLGTGLADHEGFHRRFEAVGR
jgi:hypothetical protein